MKSFFSTLKKYRYLLVELVKKDIKLKYRNSYLGVIWTLLEPLLTMIVLTIVFSSLLGKATKDFPVYILTGRLLYSYFSGATKTALKSIRKNGAMIKKVYVPKYMYPLSGVVSNYIMFLISLLVLAGVALIRGIYPTKYFIFIVLPLVQVFVFSLGTGMILATAAVFFRDLEYLWGIALMLIMYASAIFYQAEQVITPTNAWIFKLNPLYAIIVNFRNAVFGVPFDMSAFWYASGISVICLLLGSIAFYKKQDHFVLYI